MSDELLLVAVDRDTGTLLVEDETELGREVQRQLSGQLPVAGEAMGCARPIEKMQLPAFEGPGVRIAGYWHGSQIEGPGVRSVVQFQGCPIRCKGCWVPETWDREAGTNVAIDVVADALLDLGHYRDGVTIIGGEPFAQPAALHSLLGELRGRDPGVHVVVYTGYMLESLVERTKMPAPPPFEHVAADIYGALGLIDVLIDGPYIRALAHNDGCACSGELRAYTGSCNQNIRRLR